MLVTLEATAPSHGSRRGGIGRTHQLRRRQSAALTYSIPTQRLGNAIIITRSLERTFEAGVIDAERARTREAVSY